MSIYIEGPDKKPDTINVKDYEYYIYKYNEQINTPGYLKHCEFLYKINLTVNHKEALKVILLMTKDYINEVDEKLLKGIFYYSKKEDIWVLWCGTYAKSFSSFDELISECKKLFNPLFSTYLYIYDKSKKYKFELIGNLYVYNFDNVVELTDNFIIQCLDKLLELPVNEKTVKVNEEKIYEKFFITDSKMKFLLKCSDFELIKKYNSVLPGMFYISSLNQLVQPVDYYKENYYNIIFREDLFKDNFVLILGYSFLSKDRKLFSYNYFKGGQNVIEYCDNTFNNFADYYHDRQKSFDQHSKIKSKDNEQIKIDYKKEFVEESISNNKLMSVEFLLQGKKDIDMTTFKIKFINKLEQFLNELIEENIVEEIKNPKLITDKDLEKEINNMKNLEEESEKKIDENKLKDIITDTIKEANEKLQEGIKAQREDIHRLDERLKEIEKMSKVKDKCTINFSQKIKDNINEGGEDKIVLQIIKNQDKPKKKKNVQN